MEVKYELVKSVKGFNLIEIDGEKPKGIPKGNGELELLRVNDNRKVIGSTEIIKDNDKLHKLNIIDCNRLFGIKDTRTPKVSATYSMAEYGTLEELKGIQEIVRLELYNYLSGRTTHKHFLRFYEGYQTTLHEHNIIKVNDWVLDEDKDDEYFNDWLEDPELSRELTARETRTTIMVTVSSFKDESGYVNLFKK